MGGLGEVGVVGVGPASGIISYCLTILTQNLSRAHQVYWHHFFGNAAEAREI